MDVDPETRQPVGMNLMSDAREPTLRTQARSAARDHLGLTRPLTEDELAKIVAFESQIYAAQGSSAQAGSLMDRRGPEGLGPQALAGGQRALGDNVYTPVFGFFEPWKTIDSSAGVPPNSVHSASRSRGAPTCSSCAQSGFATPYTSTRSASAIR
jgi:hypothetical protein